MKKLLAVMLSVIMVFSFAACAGKSANNEGGRQTEETTTIRIGAMAGPTAMGMVQPLYQSLRLQVVLQMQMHP